MKEFKIKLSSHQNKRLKILQKLGSFNNFQQKSGRFRGRCQFYNGKSLYVTDTSKTFIFNDIENNFDIGTGDLLTVYYKKIGSKKIISNVTIDSKSQENPFQGSAYNKLQRLSLDVFQKRMSFFRSVRDFFDGMNFIELHTPTLVESPGVEKYLGVFRTNYINHFGDETTYYMPTSPEFSLKESLCSGIPRVYEIAKCFRNSGERSNTHRPDFFMLEWYRCYEDYFAIIEDCAKLILYTNHSLFGRSWCRFRGIKFDLTKYIIVSVKEMFAKFNINLDDYTENPSQFTQDISRLYNQTLEGLTKEDLFFKVMLDYIEPTLGLEQLTFLIDYPIEMTPLSVVSDNPLYGRRFELYLAGIELANGYEELIDSAEQERRFADVICERDELSLPALPEPKRFLHAMRQGIPPCSGVALGLERLLMILLDLEKISDSNLVDMFEE